MYALFAHRQDYDAPPKGGWRDIVAVHHDVEPLMKRIRKSGNGWTVDKEEVDVWHIIDLQNMMLMRASEFPEEWDVLVAKRLITVDPYFSAQCERERSTARQQV